MVALIVKAIYFIFAIIVSFNNPFPNMDSSSFFNHNEKKGLLNVISFDDGQWYKLIAEKGQQHVTPDDLLPNIKNNYTYSSYIFFPMYPCTVRILMNISGLGFVEAGFMLSIILSLTLFIFFYKFSAMVLNDKKLSFLATILLIIFPYHFYYSMLYTESLFLILLLLSFYAIEKQYWLVFIISSSLLVLTRAPGILMGIPMFVYVLEKTDKKDIFSKQTFRKALLFLFMLVTYICYGIYLKYMTGEYFAFVAAGKGWGRPLSLIPFAGLFSENFWRAYVLSTYTTVFIVIAGLAYKKIRISFLLVIFFGIMLPLATCTTNAMPRYISVLFPFMYIFAFKIAKLKLTYKSVVFITLFCLQLFSFYFFITEDYLGY